MRLRIPGCGEFDGADRRSTARAAGTSVPGEFGRVDDFRLAVEELHHRDEEAFHEVADLDIIGGQRVRPVFSLAHLQVLNRPW